MQDAIEKGLDGLLNYHASNGCEGHLTTSDALSSLTIPRHWKCRHFIWSGWPKPGSNQNMSAVLCWYVSSSYSARSKFAKALWRFRENTTLEKKQHNSKSWQSWRFYGQLRICSTWLGLLLLWLWFLSLPLWFLWSVHHLRFEPTNPFHVLPNLPIKENQLRNWLFPQFLLFICPALVLKVFMGRSWTCTTCRY